jgi:hypothetical protein
MSVIHNFSSGMFKKTWTCLVLIVLPLLLFISGCLYSRASGIGFLRGVDPEYAYLFSGAIMADMKPDIFYVDHPGTPLVIVISTVIRVVHLFRPEKDMLTDVIKNPELYLKTVLYAIYFLSSLMLFILGLFTYKRTRNIALAVFIQMIPFVHNMVLQVSSRMMPESLLIPLICLWAMVVMSKSKSGIAYGLLMGLSLALKLTLLPLLIIPLIVLQGWKSRLWFTGTFIFSFFAFAFPILFKHKIFFSWVKNIIFHTGAYGTGDQGILHWKEFYEHLKIQLGNTSLLLISLSVLIITLVIYVFVKKEGNQRDPLKVKLAIALILVVFVQYFITSKHFAYYYMSPAILLAIPMIILSGSMWHQMFPSLVTFRILNPVMMGLVILILAYTIPRAKYELTVRGSESEMYYQSYLRYKENRAPGPLIVSSYFFGCSAVEYALIFGIRYSGKYGPYLYGKMKSVYPETWLYFPWEKVFYDGINPVSPSSFLHEGTEYSLYIADYSKERLDELIHFFNQNEKGNRWITKQVYQIESTHEALFTLQSVAE